MTTDNERLAREFLERMCEEIWHQGNLDVIDDLYAPDHVAHNPDTPPEGTHRPPTVIKEGTAKMREAFPDVRVHIGFVVASSGEGEARIAYHYRLTGTHLGPLYGMSPTRRRIDVSATSISRLAGSKIVESWGTADRFGLLRQLDLVGPKHSSRGGFFERTFSGGASRQSRPPTPSRSAAHGPQARGRGWSDLELLAAFGLGWMIGDD